jgi:type I restriction enzyme R subunit
LTCYQQAAALVSSIKLYIATNECAAYGIKEKESVGERFETINLIDWDNVDANDFAIAEKVSITGNNKENP